MSRLSVRNFLSYLWLMFRCRFGNPETRKGSAHLNGVPISSPSLSALLFLYREIVLGDCYHPHELALNPVIVDCGANIGVATVYFATEYDHARVYAFEPNPEAFTYLERNVDQLGRSNIDLFQVALGAADGQADLFMSDSVGSMLASLRVDRTRWTRRVPVLVCRLSKLLHQLSRIDLVKMDIEGAEFVVLSELNEAGVLDKPLYYIIEYHNIANSSPSTIGRLISLLEDAGYRVTLTGDAIDPSGYQDILVYATKCW